MTCAYVNTVFTTLFCHTGKDITMDRRQESRSSNESRQYSRDRIPRAPAPSVNINYDPEYGPLITEMNGNMVLQACPHCSRKFTTDRIATHANICRRVSQLPPRPVFDSAKQRLAGTDAEPFARNAKPVQRHVSNWKQNHEALVASIRAARRAYAQLKNGASPSDLPPPPVTMDTSEFVQCPHCGRRFDEVAAQKHIPICQRSTHNTIYYYP